MVKCSKLAPLLLTCAAAYIAAQPAAATEPMAHVVGPDAGGPAHVVYCGGGSYGYRDTLFLQEDFAGSSPVPLKAVKIRFDLYDAFGEYLAGVSEEQTGTFASGARIQNSGVDNNAYPRGWRIRNRWPTARKIVCSIEKTLDANGNVWTNASLPSSAPSSADEARTTGRRDRGPAREARHHHNQSWQAHPHAGDRAWALQEPARRLT